jgi:hypothetical protein
MKTNIALYLTAAALALAPASAFAQSAPPSAEPSAAPASAAPISPVMRASPVYETTPAPSPSASSSATAAPSAASSATPKASDGNGAGNGNAKGNNGKHLGQIKKLQSGSLSLKDLRYALTHPVQEVNQVRKMKTVSFDKLRVYRLPTSLKSMLKVSDANADIPVLVQLAPSLELAQSVPSTNGSNSPIAILQYALANINVSNALNNVSVLNNSNVNVGVTLADVLNGNKISIGQVAGIFVNGLGIITTITK